jgi:YesN/AraC family two-component response regulator
MIRAVSSEVPIIVVSGMNEEEFALQCLQSGAQDFLVKGKIEGSAVLRAVRYAIERQKFYEQQKVVQQLRDALAQVKVLSGLLPICAACKRIRNDQGYWGEVETYIEAHSSVQFSHGICPECAADVRARMKSWSSLPPMRTHQFTVEKNKDSIVFSGAKSNSES